MIVLDSSAVVAVLEREGEHEAFQTPLENTAVCLISAVTLFETSMVVHARRGANGLKNLSEFMKLYDVQVSLFDEDQARIALEAFQRFGKGFHRARLNLGDCASYALAKSLGAPLLFKGDDFAATDIAAATPGGAFPSESDNR